MSGPSTIILTESEYDFDSLKKRLELKDTDMFDLIQVSCEQEYDQFELQNINNLFHRNLRNAIAISMRANILNQYSFVGDTILQISSELNGVIDLNGKAILPESLVKSFPKDSYFEVNDSQYFKSEAFEIFLNSAAFTLIK